MAEMLGAYLESSQSRNYIVPPHLCFCTISIVKLKTWKLY